VATDDIEFRFGGDSCPDIDAIRSGIELSAWLQNVPALVLRISREDEQKAMRIILDYRDKAFSYCDATSFAVIERLRIRDVMAFDRHLRQYGKFELLGA
jgi:predicted nucleic acid-binding protein